ncbi:putative neugrin-like protein DDB_G0288135 [Microplitis mediator]|uniref:putative neugrin-like protein DDB_G0288135 n=1 Tax=Microplitis mediator TaxID=375433 RepID=UPI002553BA91|nr:putative neugrin-like protein DDB_G0288135 [Microplitis mediator]
MAGRGARGKYNTRSRSQVDIRRYGLIDNESTTEVENRSINDMTNDEFEKTNGAAVVHQDARENIDAEKKEGNEKDSDGAESRKDENSQGNQTLSSIDEMMVDGAEEKITGAEIEKVAEYILENIVSENKRKEMEWELMLSNTLNDIVEFSKIGNNKLIKKLEEIQINCEKKAENCEYYKESERKTREGLKAEKRKWDEEREVLTERCLKAEKNNADYVQRTFTQDLLRDVKVRDDPEKRKRWNIVTSTPARNVNDERKQNEGINNKASVEEPRLLTESEVQEELRRRNKKKLIVRIQHKCKSNEEAIRVVEEKLGYRVDWNTVGRSEEGLITLKLSTLEEKRNLVTKEWKLKGTDVFIDDELTEREREIGKWLKEIEKKERMKGTMAKTGYMKISKSIREGDKQKRSHKRAVIIKNECNKYGVGEESIRKKTNENNNKNKANKKSESENKKENRSVKEKVNAENEKYIKVMCWNIAGMKEYSDINKLVEKYDVVSLIETWVEEKDIEKVKGSLSSEIRWWFKPAVRKEGCTRGRASSGHITLQMP